MKKIKQVKEENRNKEKRNVFKIIVLAVLVLIMILLSFQFAHQYGKNLTAYDENINAITEIDYSERQEYVDTIVEKGMINVNYLPNTVFKGKTSVKFNIKNIENNNGPIVFELYDEDDRCIYQSKKIELGYEMNCVELDKKLEKGMHNCKIKVGYAETGNVDTVLL